MLLHKKRCLHESDRKTLWLSFLNPRKGRSTRLQVFSKIDVLKNFANFTRKHLCWSFFLIKLQVFFNKVSYEISQIFKNTFLNKTSLLAASGMFCAEISLVKILQPAIVKYLESITCFRKIPIKKNNELLLKRLSFLLYFFIPQGTERNFFI